MMFVMLFDAPYFFWTELLMRSIYHFEPEAKIYICGVNLPKALLDRFCKMRNVVGVKNYAPKVKPHHLRHLSYYDQGLTTVIHLRPYVLLDVMNRFKDEDLFLITDVDMVLVNNLSNLKKMMETCDVGFNIVDKGKKIMAGTVAIKNNKKGKNFVERWEHHSNLNKTNPRVDQLSLKQSYKQLKKGMRIANFGKKYLDHSLDFNSYIWSAHKSYAGGFTMKLHFFQEFMTRVERGERLAEVKTEISRLILEVVRSKKKLLKGRKIHETVTCTIEG